MATTSALHERWGFLAPWCKVLEGRIDYVWAEREEEVWDVPKRRLEVNLPTRGETLAHLWGHSWPCNTRQPFQKRFSTTEDFQKCFYKVREALALLAAVAHVDPQGWRYLLKIHCGVYLGTEGEELYEEDVPASFMLFLIEDNPTEEYKEYVVTLKNDIVQFCGVHQRDQPSRGYVRSLKRIAALDEELKLGKPGVELRIPVQIGFRVMDFISYGVLSDILQPLKDIREAEKFIDEEWAMYEQRHKPKEVEPGQLRCTFVLGPMLADFHDTNISAEVAQTMETMVQENARFSQVNLWTFVTQELEKKEHEGKMVFGRMIASVFDTTRRAMEISSGRHPGSNEQLQLGSVHLECASMMAPPYVEALCSGIVASQTTKKLSMQLEMEPDVETSTHWWKWLAYALFSKRARTCSAVESLALISIRSMSVADVEVFASVLKSNHPEEILFGCARGTFETKDATVKEGASTYWELNKRGQPRRGSHALTCRSDIHSALTFHDDGISEWVTTLVPAYGRCHVRRQDLDFAELTIAPTPCGGVTDLRIGFEKMDDSITDGLPNFLALVGPSLKSLTLDTSQLELDGSAPLRCCPNLEELSLIGGDMVDLHLDFGEYRANGQPNPELSFEWDNVSALANDLSITDGALAKCVRRLRVYLIDEWATWGIIVADQNDRPAFQAGLRALLQMLEVNQSLEYIDIVVPFGHFIYLDDFRNYHLKPINRALELPMETKIAFLSVFSSRPKATELNKKKRVTRSSRFVRPLCDLNQHVVSKIFAFAAPRVLRKVYLRDPPRNNWDEPDRIPI